MLSLKPIMVSPPTHPPTLPLLTGKESDAELAKLKSLKPIMVSPPIHPPTLPLLSGKESDAEPQAHYGKPTHPPTHKESPAPPNKQRILSTHPPTHPPIESSTSLEPPESPLPSYKQLTTYPPTHPPTHPPTSKRS